MSNRIKDEKIFTGGMDQDTDSKFVSKVDWLEARNLIKSENGNNGVLTNLKGNTYFHTGTYLGKAVGEVTDVTNNRMYFATVYNAELYIYKYNFSDDTLLCLNDGNPIPEFIADEDRFCRLRLLDDLLFINDTENTPRKINVSRCESSYYYDERVGTELIKTPHCEAPIFYYGLNAFNTGECNVWDNTFQFSIQYEYEDGEKSVWSPFSKIAINPDYHKSVLDPTINRNNTGYKIISIAFNRGSKYVSKVHIIAKINDVNTYYKIETIDARLGTIQEYTFTNNNAKIEIDAVEVNKYYDAVPLKSNDIDIIEESRLSLAGNTKEYLPDDITFNVTPEYNSLNWYTIWKTLKKNSDYKIGIQYFDYALRPVGGVLNPKEINVPFKNGDDFAKSVSINLEITSRPPTQAYYWSPVLSRNSKYEAFVQTIVYKAQRFYDSKGKLSPYVALKVRNTDDSSSYLNNYNFEKGDKLRLLRAYANAYDDRATGTMDDLERITDYIETEVLDVLTTIYVDKNADPRSSYLPAYTFATPAPRTSTRAGSESQVGRDGKPYTAAKKKTKIGSKLAQFGNWVSEIGEKDRSRSDLEAPTKQEIVDIRNNINAVKAQYDPTSDIEITADDGIKIFAKVEDGVWLIIKPLELTTQLTSLGFDISKVEDKQIDKSGYLNSLIEVYKPKKHKTEELYYQFGYCLPIGNPTTGTRYHKSLSSIDNSGGYYVNDPDYIYNRDQSSNASLSCIIRIMVGDSYIRKLYRNAIYDTKSNKENPTDAQVKPKIPTRTIVKLSLYMESYYPLEDNINNDVYSYSRPYIELPEAKEVYENSVMYSDKYIQNTNVNGLSSFDEFDKIQLTEKYGKIKAIEEIGKTLNIYCENKVISAYIGSTEFTNADGSTQLITSNKVLGNTRVSDTDYGTVNPESVNANNGNVYFFDLNSGAVLKDNQGGIVPISDYKMKSYFRAKAKSLKESITHAGVVKVNTGYDNEYDILYCTIKDSYNPDNNETILFHDESKTWISFADLTDNNGVQYDRITSIGNTLVTLHGGKVYKHNSDSIERNNFYGSQKESKLVFYANNNPNIIKIFDSIAIHSTKAWDVNSVVTEPNLDYELGMYSFIKAGHFVTNEGILRASFKRNIFSGDGSTLYLGSVTNVASDSITLDAIGGSIFQSGNKCVAYNKTTGEYCIMEYTEGVGETTLYYGSTLPITFTNGDDVIVYHIINLLRGELLRGYDAKIELVNNDNVKVELFKVDVTEMMSS